MEFQGFFFFNPSAGQIKIVLKSVYISLYKSAQIIIKVCDIHQSLIYRKVESSSWRDTI